MNETKKAILRLRVKYPYLDDDPDFEELKEFQSRIQTLGSS